MGGNVLVVWLGAALLIAVGLVAASSVFGDGALLPVGIWLPLAFAVGNLAGLVLVKVFSWTLPERRSLPIWASQHFRSVFWAAQGIGLYTVVACALFGAVALTVVYDVGPSGSEVSTTPPTAPTRQDRCR